VPSIVLLSLFGLACSSTTDPNPEPTTNYPALPALSLAGLYDLKATFETCSTGCSYRETNGEVVPLDKLYHVVIGKVDASAQSPLQSDTARDTKIIESRTVASIVTTVSEVQWCGWRTARGVSPCALTAREVPGKGSGPFTGTIRALIRRAPDAQAAEVSLEIDLFGDGTPDTTLVRLPTGPWGTTPPAYILSQLGWLLAVAQ
jgi:hypothetical protein